MHKLAALLTTAVATTAMAQSPLATLNLGGNQGNEGGGIYFDLTVNTTITITAINFRAGNTATNPAGSINTGQMNVYLGPTTFVGNVTNAALWTQVTQTMSGSITHNATGPAAGTLSPGPLATPIALGPGNYGVALESQAGIWNHNYSNPGNPTTFSNAELTLNAGAAQNAFLTGSIFQPRIFNGEIVYNLGGTPIAVASQEQYGTGCYKFNTSFHEIFPNPTGVDIANTTHLYTFQGDKYAVSSGATPYTAPVGANLVTFPTAAPSVVLASAVLGAPLPFPILYPKNGGVEIASDLEICSAGYITPVSPTTPAGVNAPDNSATVVEWYSAAERWAPHWKPFDPALGGMVSVGIIGGDVVISWEAVISPLSAANPSTFQVVFKPTSDVEMRFQTLSLFGGGSEPVIVGWTQGGGALENPLDLSVAVPAGFTTATFDNTPLDIQLSARPVLGSSPNFLIQGYDAATAVGATILSFTQFNPGISLAGVGAPGCFQYVNIDAINVFFTTPGQTTFPFINGGIPNNVTFNGILLYGQAATFTAGLNPLGVITSNGLRVLLGSL